MRKPAHLFVALRSNQHTGPCLVMINKLGIRHYFLNLQKSQKKVSFFFRLTLSTQENCLIVYITYQLSQLSLCKAVIVKFLYLRIPLSTLDTSGSFLKTLTCNCYTVQCSDCTPGHSSQRNKNLHSHKNLHTNAYSSFTHNSPKLEKKKKTQRSFNE